MQNKPSELITTKEAANRAGVTRQAVELWCDRLPALVGRREKPRLVKAEMVAEIIAARSIFGRLSAA